MKICVINARSAIQPHGLSPVDVDGRAVGAARLAPLEEPPGVVGAQVDASVAARAAESIMPVGSVQGIAAVEVAGPGDLFQMVIATFTAIQHLE